MKFSIVIPTYNRFDCLKSTINSVINQYFNDWELIVVDDGSTDNTQEVVDSFNDSRIKYVYQENSERSVARNNGITNSTGEWICFLDSDDEFKLDHLSIIAEFLVKENPLPGLIATGLLISIGNESKKKEFLNFQNNIITEIGKKFLIPTQVCVHRSILVNEKFDRRFRLWEDTHLWLRIAAQYPVYQIEEYTAIQNIHDEGTVAQGMKQVNMTDVNQYLMAINDLKENYKFLFENKIPKDYFYFYMVSKIKMYLYRARQNRQFRISFRIFFIGMRINPSIYFISELPKIVLNRVNIGISNEGESR